MRSPHHRPSARGPRTAAALACLLAVAAARPARADVLGGIEIGAKGVKATVVDFRGGPEGSEVKVLLGQTANTTLTAGLAASGRFDRNALRETVAAVGSFADRMRGEFKVPAERIHVVGSSGLFSAVSGKPDLITENQTALAAAVEKATGQKMTFLSPAREAELSVSGIVPRKYADAALLVDVGSGNTKGGLRADGRVVTFSVPFGSVSFADLVKQRARKDGVPFDGAAAAARAEAVAPALKKSFDGFPARDRVYLSGGAVWALATLARPGDRGPYVELTAADVARYRRMLLAEPAGVPAPDLSAVTDPAARDKAAAEARQVRDTFTRENLLAGAEILQALADELAGPDAGRKFYFARNGYLGWILAYVQEQAGAAR